MKKTWAGRAYLIALHIGMLVVLARHEGLARLHSHGQSEDLSGGLIDRIREAHRQMDASVPAGATLFLGDSITMGLATAAVAPVSVNYGIGWQRSDQLLRSMDIYYSMSRAQAVVVTIGTNDALQNRTAGLSDRYRAILAKIPAGVPVVMSGIPAQRQRDVRPVVAMARSACAADRRCTFVDAFTVGSAPGALLPDGIHLTPAGYAAWIPMLRQALATAHHGMPPS